jgi:hypothetical protein
MTEQAAPKATDQAAAADRREARRKQLCQVVADLATEGDVLDELVAPLDEAGWRTPTPAAGWDVAHQVAHLAWTDEMALHAATDKEAWDASVLKALEDPEGFVDKEADRLSQVPPAELLSRWREGRARLAETLLGLPDGTKLPWYGPPMSATSMATARFMETWAHSLDVRTRDFAFSVHRLEAPAEQFRVELASPGGETWTFGPEDAAQSVRGSAYDFCLLVTQRRHRDDLDLVATGPDADRWLDIAQAFAGPPGGGREPQAGTSGEPA